MDWRLCPRVWRVLACAGLPAPFKARSATAESTGRREESLSPDKPCLLASLCSAQKDNLKHADRVGSPNGGRRVFCFYLERRMMDHIGRPLRGDARGNH